DPGAALENLAALDAAGLAGRYGYYEAMEYTPSRVPPGRRGVVVQAYFAHHQGMGLVALGEVLNNSPMRRRFHDEPRIKATELLLQERVPARVPVVQPQVEEAVTAAVTAEPALERAEHIPSPDTQVPRVQLLSNGRYGVQLTA